MTEPAIRIEGLGKEYVIGGAESYQENFREMMASALIAPFRKFRRLGGKDSQQERFWALKASVSGTRQTRRQPRTRT